MEHKREGWFARLWIVTYPLLLYFGISILVQVVTYFVVVLGAVADAGLSAWMEVENQQAIVFGALETYLGQTYNMTLISAVLTIPFLYLFMHLDKKKRVASGKHVVYNKAGISEYVMLAVVALGACIAGNNLIMASGLIEMDETYQQVSELLYSAPLMVQILGTGIIVPLCEEMIFRGLMFRRMADRSPVMSAMISSSMIFGLYHGNLVQAVYAFALGMLMAYSYEKYRSFLAPALFHMAANLLSVLISNTNFFDFMYESKAMMLISGLAGLAIVYMGVRLIRENVQLQPLNAGEGDMGSENL